MSQETIGERLRRLRRERGRSQADLAGDDLSPSYVSLIEAGKRTPTPAVLESFAARLGCAVALLVEGVDPAAQVERELELRYAELALQNGEAAEAQDRFRRLVEELDEDAPPLLVQARWGYARALEAAGYVEPAIGAYDVVRAEAETDLRSGLWLPAVIALCRCYADVGDLSRAIEIGEAARRRVEELALEGGDEAVELSSTLVGCYDRRGDLVTARLLADHVIEQAERLGSPRARGAAYWNASLLADQLGRPAEALNLAERALALYGEGCDARNLARLRVAYAWLLLRQSPPRPDEAEPLLNTAREELSDTGGQVDLASCEAELARTRLLRGQPQQALEMAEAALCRLGDHPRVEAAHLRLVMGQAHLLLGDTASAMAAYHRAGRDLQQMGASRLAAQSWRELAEAFASAGRTHEALAAYRNASDAAGVRTPTPVFRDTLLTIR